MRTFCVSEDNSATTIANGNEVVCKRDFKTGCDTGRARTRESWLRTWLLPSMNRFDLSADDISIPASTSGQKGGKSALEHTRV